MIKLIKLFDVNNGNKLDMNKMSAGDINFVGRSGLNQGVTGRVSLVDGIAPYPAGLITVALGGTVLSSFLQTSEFYTGQNVVVLNPKTDLTDAEMIYYCSLIKANAFRFTACGREANRFLRDLMLPEKIDFPNWVNPTAVDLADKTKRPLVEAKLSLNSHSWQVFFYRDLFYISRGIGPRKKDIRGCGNTPFITSTDRNNGLTAFCEEPPTHEGNTLTVNRNGSVAETFFQPDPFCSTEDVHIFQPKFRMNQYIGLFFAALIKREKYRYSYGRKWGIERMLNSVIKLPVKDDDSPDFDFMEIYIKSLPYSSQI